MGRDRHTLPRSGALAQGSAFRMFRHKQKPALCCAVPDGGAPPSFLEQGEWLFEGTLSEPQSVLVGFRPRAASVGVRLNGFYLFQHCDDRRPCHPPSLHSIPL